MATLAAALGPVMAGMSMAKPRSLNRISLRSSESYQEIGSLASQFSGVKISTTHSPNIAPVPFIVPPRSLRTVASRVCPFTGKKSNKANQVSHSNHKTIKRQFVNLQYKRMWWEAGKRYVKLRLSTKAIKTIEKNGLDAMAKKAGIDLSKK
ncbi:50S ribosomal protein L28- chloroplastic [Striga hermonthica]|uniref:Large ribosomal subunit protein bL28c n=1 Tax=Striga hermonthica TaxID=68872 RepID=A0A9N7MYY3_STRHE|nr:50S ribosomal protein L28- chloroplastic [Striga hermonthica]